MKKSEQPIAVFDSGVGGISVLREMVKIMPYEDFIYYGDSKHAPYGTKSLEEVRELTISHTRELMGQGAKAVAIACNTATSAAVRILRQMYPQLPLVGIEPALKPAVLFKPHPTVLVMATPMTIREEKFHRLLAKYEHQATIYPLPCPGLMEYVERGQADSPEVREFLRNLLGEYLEKAWMPLCSDAHTIPLCSRPLPRRPARKCASSTAGRVPPVSCAAALIWRD